MATYKITAPGGQSYNVNAPDDATEAQVMDYAQRNFKMLAKEKKPETTIAQDVLQHGKNTVGGFIRGAGSIGATFARPFETGAENEERRARIDTNMANLVGADPNSLLYKGFKLGGEIAGTAGAGGVVAKGAMAVPMLAKYAAPVIDAIGSSGMTSGGLAGAKGLATRAIGGAVGGGVSAGMVDPRDAGTGAAIGFVAPAVIQGMGKAGMAVYNAYKGNKPGAGAMLAKAMGVSEAELPAIISALEKAPDSIVDGSKLTVNQALQNQGANTPGSKLLERIVSGGPGGDVLLKRYAEQNTARLGALERNGAQVYQGAAKMEAENAGNKIGAILRTQAADDKAAARAAWERVYGQASKDGTTLHLPLDEMQGAMEPLGRGSVITGADARRVLSTAEDIGMEQLPEVAALAKSPVLNSQSLEQAVRSAGGIRGKSGELRDLGIRQSGTTGMINNKTGQSADILAEQMHRRGFIPDADPATLFDALRNGGGRKLFANDAVENNGYQRMMEASMGDLPEAAAIPKAVPFAEFQRLRRDSGSLAAKAGERAGGETEAGVLGEFQRILTQRADDAAAGRGALLGDNMTPEFLNQYNAARGMTRTNAELYKGGNNIASILRKPVGQDYTLGGDEVVNKLWHGGGGLADDVSRLKNTLSANNYDPAMDSLRKYIMTDAAGKVTAGGDLASALPRYVEGRMPGLQEALNPDQLKGLLGVASDIRNADAASNVKGLLGSDTHAKVSRALDGGLLDSPIAKTLANFKGANMLRDKAVEMVKTYKGKTISELMANPKEAAKALSDARFVAAADPAALKALERVVLRSAPVAIQTRQAETQ